MKMRKSLLPLSAALLVSLSWFPAFADAGKVVIGDIDDMSGLYADINGPGRSKRSKWRSRTSAARRSASRSNCSTADHQNKPDLGVQKFREWVDRDGLTMVLGGANTGVSLAIAAAVKEKRVPFFAIGAAGASLTGKDCTPYTVHYAYDTTALSNGAASDDRQRGRQDMVLRNGSTTPLARSCRSRPPALSPRTAGRSSARCRVPLATPDFASYVLQAQNSGAQVLGPTPMRAPTSPTR